MGWPDFDTPFTVHQVAADKYQVIDTKGAVISDCRFLTDASRIVACCNALPGLITLLVGAASRLHAFREQDFIATINAKLLDLGVSP